MREKFYRYWRNKFVVVQENRYGELIFPGRTGLLRFGELSDSPLLPQGFFNRVMLLVLGSVITIAGTWLFWPLTLFAMFIPIVGGKQEFVLQPIFDKIEPIRAFIVEGIIENIIKIWLCFLCLCLIAYLATKLWWLWLLSWVVVAAQKIVYSENCVDTVRLILRSKKDQPRASLQEHCSL
jgi:hypothetical protein